MVRLDKLTQRSQDALQHAQELAESSNNSQIEVEHLLLALLEQVESLCEIILSQMGVDVGSLKEKLKDELSLLPKTYFTGQAPPPPTAGWLTYKTEFLNRIDEIIVFHSLSFEEIKKIVDLQFEEVNRRLAEQEMTTSSTEKAKEHLAKIGFDPAFGARPLKRMIQKEVSQPLANEILKGKFRPKDKIKIDVKDNTLVFQ